MHNISDKSTGNLYKLALCWGIYYTENAEGNYAFTAGIPAAIMKSMESSKKRAGSVGEHPFDYLGLLRSLFRALEHCMVFGQG